MPASAVYFLDLAGRVILHRDYRGDIPLSLVERLVAHIGDLEEAGRMTPVLHFKGVTFVVVPHTNLYIVAATRTNANAVALLLFLHRIIAVFAEYFGELLEESLRDNFVIIFELLDEVMDFGYPQFTEAQILRSYIKTNAHRLAMVKPPTAVTNAISWRRDGIKYKKNEVFLDVIERVNMLLTPSGQVVHGEVHGTLNMKTYLSGMPECKLGLNEKVLMDTKTSSMGASSAQKAVELEDIKFHQCVRLTGLDRDRTIAFVPPDGEFNLMTYRITGQVKPLVHVESQVETLGRTRMMFNVRASMAFKARSTAQSVVLRIPLPSDCHAPEAQCTVGTTEYRPEKEALLWKIKAIQGGKEASLRVKVSLPMAEAEESLHAPKPIEVSFDIPYYTVSGLQVRYLKVSERSGYQAAPWVRYISSGGDYACRLGVGNAPGGG